MRYINTRKEAQICFKDLCAKVYGENAALINSLATIAALVILMSVVSKALRK